MIITHVLQPLDGQTNISVGHEFNVQFTFENFGERDYEIYEISSEKNIKILDTSDNLITLPLNVPSGSQVSIKFNFTIENREFLPLSVFISTTEQGRTDHVIRISEKVVEPIEEPTSELQILDGVINLERDLDAEEVLSTKTGSNPYTITFDAINIGTEDLDINELVFIDHDFNKYDFITIAQDSVDNTCIDNGSNIPSGQSRTISFTIDLSNSGLFGTNLLSLNNVEDVSTDGFDLSDIGAIYFKTNSLKSYYSPIRFSEETTTVNEGVFIFPVSGTLYLSSAIEIISNTEGTYDNSKQYKISLENLIVGTNRRTEQIIIKNYGIDPFNIESIESNYLVNASDALKYYEYGSEITYPLTINAGDTKYIDIYFDDVKLIDDADSTNSLDDIGSKVSFNRTFFKTITITTETGVYNTDESDELNVLVPLSIYKNQYTDPYDWVFVEERTRMSLVDGNGDFYSGATYELPFGYGLRRMYPSEQKVTQIRIKNNNLSDIKYFRAEVLDNNKNWKNTPYLVQTGLNTSVDREGSLYFQVKPGEVTGTSNIDDVESHLGDNHKLLCIVQTNSGNEMEYEYMSEHFDDKYDLKKEGENIVIKITEGVWTDGNFIELTDTNSIGYEVERSMVQYVVATWKPMTFTYWGVSKYNHHNYYYPPNTQEEVKFFRPRDFSLYSTSNYKTYEEDLYTLTDVAPITRAWSVSKVDPPKETISEIGGILKLFSNVGYALQNLYTDNKDGETLSFSDDPPSKTITKFSLNKYSIDYSLYPAKEWLNEFEKDTEGIPPKTVELYSVNEYSYDNDVVTLIKGDAVVVIPPSYKTHTKYSLSNYDYLDDINFNWETHIVFSHSTYEYSNESLTSGVVDVQPASFKTIELYSVNNYTHESTGSDMHQKEELKLIAPTRHIWYSLSRFFPVFDWTGDMEPQLVVEVEGNSVPKTITTYSTSNYEYNFVPAFVETGKWEVIKPPS